MKWSAILFLIVTQANGQFRIEPIPLSPVKINTGFYIYGAGSLISEIPYSKINGSPFWNPEYIMATLILSNGNAVSRYPVKLNIVTNDVNFINDKGEEFTAGKGIIRKIIFHPPDSSFVAFRNDLDLPNANQKPGDEYVQELNEGNIQLLKLSKKMLKVGDSLLGTQKKYSFYLQESYFIKQENRIHWIRKLSQKEIAYLITLDKDTENWIRKNNVELSKEKGVIALFGYLNAREYKPLR